MSNRNCHMEQGYVNRDGVELYYKIKGTNYYKPTLVFVHGEGMNSEVWPCQQDFFCKYYQTLVIDMRGFGKSSKPPGPLTAEVHAADLKAVLDALGIIKIYLAGWSAGGLVSLAFTLTYPEYVEKLVLIDTAPQVLADEKFPYGRTKEQEAELLALIELNYPKYAAEGAEATVPETCDGAELVRNKIHEILLSDSPNIVLRQTFDITLFSAVDKLSIIGIPTLIFFGGKDTVINYRSSLFMCINIPNSQIYEFPDAGHSPFLTFYQQFNDRLLVFLKNEYPCQICNKFIK